MARTRRHCPDAYTLFALFVTASSFAAAIELVKFLLGKAIFNILFAMLEAKDFYTILNETIKNDETFERETAKTCTQVFSTSTHFREGS
jgi:hypothetical protein